MPGGLAEPADSGGREEDRSLQVICHRTGDETVEFAMEDREGCGDGLSQSQANGPAGIQGECASGYWRLTQRDGIMEEGWLVPGGSAESSGHRGREGEQACMWPAAELRMRLI